MRKIFVVAWREYQAAVRTKAFLLGLLLMPVLMGAGVVIQVLLSNVRDTEPKRFVVIDRSGDLLWDELEKTVNEYNATQLVDPQTGQQIHPAIVLERVPASSNDDLLRQRFEQSERVRRGEIMGFLDIGPDVLTSTADKPDDRASVRYHTSRPTVIEFPRIAERTINRTVQEHRAAQRQPAVTDVKGLVRPVPMETRGLLRRDDQQTIHDASPLSHLAPLLIPVVLCMLMFMIVMLGSTPLMQGIVEEKLQRVAEVLLGSVRPFSLMLGKLLGMTGVTLTISGFYIAGLWISAERWKFAEFLTPSLIVWFLLFQVLACLMYGSLFISVGAACSDMKETQNLLWPIIMLVCLPLFALPHVLREPSGPVAIALSYFPFSAPMMMMTRMAIPPGVAWWEPILATALVLATTLTCVWIAGRIFRVGILLQGQGGHITDMIRWVVRG